MNSIVNLNFIIIKSKEVRNGLNLVKSVQFSFFIFRNRHSLILENTSNILLC